jgi:hypothetical protein
MAAVGYSGKSLADKLGLKDGLAAAAIDPPPHYAKLVAPTKTPGKFGKADYVFIHLFAPTRAALAKQLPRAVKQLAPGGMLWVSWPKKTSPLFKDLTEEGVREFALPLGVVDVKVCAVDEDWSGLKLMWRRKA